MSKFCTKSCNNLLTPFYSNDEASFRCNVCHMVYEFNDEDTLRYSNIKQSDVLVHKKLLDNAVKDPAAQRVRKDCIYCDGKFVVRVRIGADMTLFNICIKCEKKWLN